MSFRLSAVPGGCPPPLPCASNFAHRFVEEEDELAGEAVKKGKAAMACCKRNETPQRRRGPRMGA
jgi:hypothetical protein